MSGQKMPNSSAYKQRIPYRHSGEQPEGTHAILRTSRAKAQIGGPAGVVVADEARLLCTARIGLVPALE